MASDDGPRIQMSGSGLSAPPFIEATNKFELEGTRSGFDVPPAERPEVPAQFRGKILRIIDDQLFVVDAN